MMKSSGAAFETPNWDSNTLSDKICNKLFKRKTSQLKPQNSELSNKGKVIKAKLKQKIKRREIVKHKDDLNASIKKKLKNKSSKSNANINFGNDLSKNENNIKNKNILKHIGAKALKRKRNEGENLSTDQPMRQKIKTKTYQDEIKTKLKKIRKGKKDPEKTALLDTDNGKISRKPKKKRNIDKDTKHDLKNTEEIVISKKSKKPLSLRERMLERIKSARFRFINEQIYSSGSDEAQQFFAGDRDSFNAYHEGYRQQVNRWPINPLDVIIKSIQKMPKNYVIADFGCGEGMLSQKVQQKVHSFDLVAVNEHITECDMSKVPLPKDSVDVVVFCLSLMGTNLHDYLREANRVLKAGGVMKIAEVESRFDNVNEFIEGVHHFGFKIIHKNLSFKVFYFMDFKKLTNIKKSRVLPTLSLNPCMYKKR